MTPRGYGPGACYCPRCAAALPGPAPTTCTRCRYQLFVNARPTVGLIVLDRRHEAVAEGTAGRRDVILGRDPLTGPVPDLAALRFLALRRAAEPRAGHWEMPGGFCDGWEHPAEAAVREAREELGVGITLGEHIGMYIGSYEFQEEVLPVLDHFFLATLDDPQIVLDPAESAELGWFSLVEPPPLAFATMDSAVRDVARRLGG